jgi:hypothetical protein
MWQNSSEMLEEAMDWMRREHSTRTLGIHVAGFHARRNINTFTTSCMYSMQ